MAWKNWKDLCSPKAEGGLGFREFKIFNQALLAKLGWMLISGHQSLCTRLLRSKYKVRDGWLNIGTAYQASPIWRGIEKAREVLKKRACYAVGNGHKVRVWEDLWIPWLENFKPRPKNNLVEQQSLVVS
jgi:hypothetical protein